MPRKLSQSVTSSRILIVVLHSINILLEFTTRVLSKQTNVLNISLIHVSTCTIVYSSNDQTDLVYDSSSRSNHAFCLWDSPTQTGLALHRLLLPVVWHLPLLSGVLYQLPVFLSVLWTYLLLLPLVRYQLFP